MERYEVAQKYKNGGCNCSQSVILAYKDLLNLDEETLLNLTSGFCAGMGNMEATCGALIGANMVLGLLNNTNKRTMMLSRELIIKFEELSHATICKDLKGIETGIVLCPCIDCVKNACLALDELLKAYNIKY